MAFSMARSSSVLRSFTAPVYRSFARVPAFSQLREVHTAPPVVAETPLTETVRDFLDPGDFYDLLANNGMNFYTGVPDSLLKDFCAYVSDTTKPHNHVITANEGASIGVAGGYYLATRKFPVVYMQNSGFGNAVNPLLSFTDPRIYSIPMLILIGWRGEPGKKDEPQHIVQGKAMSSLLTDVGLNYEVLPDFIEGANSSVESAIHHMNTRSAPYVFLVKRQTFSPYKMKNLEPNAYPLTREQVLNITFPLLGHYDITVSTTGFTSREVYEYRAKHKQGHHKDFLTVGSMGHATAIGLGLAVAKPSRQVVVVDGDGAALMHMGTMGTIGKTTCENFKHILINNGAHDSVGGQPTGAFNIDFPAVALAMGYKWGKVVKTEEEIIQATKELMAQKGPALLEIRTAKGARKDLGRPKTSPADNKKDFMQFCSA